MKSKALLRIFVLFVSASIFLPTPSFALNTERGPVRVGCVDIDDFLTISDSTASGYGADYLNKISEYTGWSYEYVRGTWNELMQKLEEGEIDLLFPAGYSAERAERFNFSTVACCIDFAALVTYSDNDRLYFEDYGHYDGITIGMIRGNLLNDFVRDYAAQHNFSYEIKWYANNGEITAALEAHEVDAIVMGALNSGKNQKLLAKFEYMPAYFMTNRQDAGLLAGLNDALFSITLDDPNFTASLTEKYYGASADFAKCFTREEAEYAAGLAPLRVVCDSDNYPFEWYDSEAGCYRGVNIDIINMIADAGGLQLEYVYTEALEQSWKLIRDGEAELIAGIYVDEHISDEYNIKGSSSYIEEQSVAVGKSGRKILASDELTVAVSSSLIGLNSYLAESYPHWTVINPDTHEDCIAAVQKGEADITFVNIMQMQTAAIFQSSQELAVIPGITVTLPVSLGVSDSADPLLLSIINKATGSIKNADIQSIYVANAAFDRSHFSISNIIRYQPLLFITVVLLIAFVIFAVLLILVRFRMRERQAAELRRKNEELVLANAAKSEFFAHMSHDMRTPMNAIINFSGFGERSETLDEARAYHVKINAAGQYLTGLINDTLDMNRIETGALVLSLSPCTSEDFVESVRNVVAPRALEKNIDFTIKRLPSASRTVLIDKLHLQQIIVNLTFNAIKFTPENGRVELTVDSREYAPGELEIIFTVSDNGIGMTSEFIEKRLYRPYERENRMNDETGTGLGLSIVKSLVDEMGGEIHCKSAPGEGTTFTVVIRAPVAVLPEPRSEDELKSLSGRRLLLCEDHPMNTQIAVKLLSNRNIEVDCAQNGKAGFDMFASSPPGYYDAVLMDIRMPVMDGIEATRAIRGCGHRDALTIPVIAMTANAYEGDVKRTVEAGMTAYLVKPIAPDMLYSTLDSALAGKPEDGRRDANEEYNKFNK